MIKLPFYFELYDKDFPYLEKINPYHENGKKYYSLCLEPFCLSFEKTDNGEVGTLAYLFIDDSSVLAGNFKKIISDSSQEGRRFSTSFSNLKFKHNPYKKRILSGNGFFVKNTNEVKELSEPDSLSTSINFKVNKSTKTRLDKLFPEGSYENSDENKSYGYELEIEPFSLGIEGLPNITRIVFVLWDKNPVTGKSGMENFREKYEKLIFNATGKELTLEVKKWEFASQHGHYNTLGFKSDDSFGEIVESRNDNNYNDNQITQFQTNAKKSIQQSLKDNNLKTSDLDSKFTNWETELIELDSESKIKEFQRKLEQEIQAQKDKQQKSENNNNNGLSLPVKLLIGGGVILVFLIVIIAIVGLARKSD